MFAFRSLGGCGGDVLSAFGGDELALGSAAPTLDLKVCQRTDCTTGMNPRPMLEFEVEHTCEFGEPIALTAEWDVRLTVPSARCSDPSSPDGSALCDPSYDVEDSDCPGFGPCQLHPGRIRAAPDGSLWMASQFSGPRDTVDPTRIDPTRGGVMLHNFAPDGSLRRAQVLVSDHVEGTSVQYTPVLTVDGRGHVFVEVMRYFSADTASGDEVVLTHTLFELDDRGERVGVPVAFAREKPKPNSGWENLRLAPAGGALALGEQRLGGGGIALLDSETRNLRWVQTRAGRLGLVQLVGDSQGGVTMATRSPNGMPSGRIEHYGPDGRLSWERACRPPHPAAYSGMNLAVDARGELVVISNENSELSVNLASIYKISASGDPLWAMRVPDFARALSLESGIVSTIGLSGYAVLPTGQVIYMPTAVQYEDGTFTVVFIAFSADGERCRRYDWRPERDIQLTSSFDEQLAVGPDAQVYVQTPGGLTRVGFDAGLLP